MLEDFLVNSAIGTLLIVVKNPKKVKAMKSAMLKVFRAIRAAFPGDPDFE